ncbi:MAG: hypothetical protein HQK66_02380 [Desulfamplus sp.]|nr:hypothetical protein [Desulfamplus sp.]
MNIKEYGTKELENEYGPLTFGNALESYRSYLNPLGLNSLGNGNDAAKQMYYN